MITIKRLDVTEIQSALKLVKEFYQAYDSKDKLNLNKCRLILEAATFYQNIYFAIVLKDQDEIVGLLIGLASDHPFLETRVASELGWFVKPEHRGVSSVRMLDEFENWAANEAKVDYVSMAYTTKMSQLKNLYERKNYELSELTYVKRIT